MEFIARGKYVLISCHEKGEDDAIIKDGAVLFRNGCVAEVGDFESLRNRHPSMTIKGNGKQLLMPGIIDAHSHGWGLSGFQRGVPYDFLENCLIDWAYLQEIDPELTGMMTAFRHLRSGSTTMHLNFLRKGKIRLEDIEKTISGCRQVGIRLALSPGGRHVNTLALNEKEFVETLPVELQSFAKSVIERNTCNFVNEYFEVFEDLSHRYNGDDVRIFFGPSWTHGCSEGFLKRLKARADELGGIPIHLHTLQTPIQKAYGIKTYGKSLLGHLDDIGLVDHNLTLGHAVYLSESDIELLAAKGASTTHHPSCNLAMRNGISPVYYLQRAGVNVALGIDDKGINDDEDAIMELRMIHKLHRFADYDLACTPPLDGYDVLKMGTINAAKACGYEDEIGELLPGKKGDAILIDLEEILEDPWMAPGVDIIEAFIHRAKGIHVNTVIVDGCIIMEERKFLTIDIDDLFKEVRKEVSKGIERGQREFADKLQEIKPYYQRWYSGWEKSDYRPFYIANSRNS